MARPTDWVDTQVDSGISAGGQVIKSLITGLAPEEMRGVTAIRTIISLSVFSQTIAGSWGLSRVDMAIGVTSQEAFAAGVVPDPNVATDKPARGWLWRTQRVAEQNGASTRVVTHVQADIRGGRKIENGEMYLVINNSITGGGASFRVKVVGLVRVVMLLS